MNISDKTFPELLCIGFLCHDLHNGKHLLGGTASYSSIMASQLGMNTAILTSVGEDFEFHSTFKQYNIELCNVPSEKTTVFENIYKDGRRIQFMHRRAKPLLPQHLPTEWEKVPIVKFCLIADEVDETFLQMFPEALVGATIQGWLRQWDQSGLVSPKEMDWEILRFVDIVFMSEDDIEGYEYAIPIIAEAVQLLVMTKGHQGAVIFYQGQEFSFPAFPTNEVDPTGAGDIFAASFLVKFNQTKKIS